MEAELGVTMPEYVTVLRLSFSDGGPDEFQILQRGTKESCIRVAEMMTAVSTNGSRPNPKAVISVGELDDAALLDHAPDDLPGIRRKTQKWPDSV